MSLSTSAVSEPRHDFGVTVESLFDKNPLPDWLIRAGIRAIVAGRLREQAQSGVDAQSARVAALLDSLRGSAIAVSPEAANQQHNEVPAAFFELGLGPHLNPAPRGGRTGSASWVTRKGACCN
jgi:cyclopropane-fatty-acyl-phospholipid synthase